MAKHVSTKICDAVLATVLSFPGIAELDDSVYANLLDQATRSDEQLQALREAIKADETDGTGLGYVEMEPGQSEMLNPDDVTSCKPVIEWLLPIAFFVHLPMLLGEDPDEPGKTLSPRKWAQDFFVKVQEAFEPLDLESGQLGGLAQYTNVIGGGGVALSDIGTKITKVVLIVRYRTRRGSPWENA